MNSNDKLTFDENQASDTWVSAKAKTNKAKTGVVTVVDCKALESPPTLGNKPCYTCLHDGQRILVFQKLKIGLWYDFSPIKQSFWEGAKRKHNFSRNHPMTDANLGVFVLPGGKSDNKKDSDYLGSCIREWNEETGCPMTRSTDVSGVCFHFENRVIGPKKFHQYSNPKYHCSIVEMSSEDLDDICRRTNFVLRDSGERMKLKQMILSQLNNKTRDDCMSKAYVKENFALLSCDELDHAEIIYVRDIPTMFKHNVEQGWFLDIFDHITTSPHLSDYLCKCDILHDDVEDKSLKVLSIPVPEDKAVNESKCDILIDDVEDVSLNALSISEADERVSSKGGQMSTSERKK